VSRILMYRMKNIRNEKDVNLTYDHRTLRIRLPVRSALYKQCTGGLVVRWVTTSESPLLYVLILFLLSCVSRGACLHKARNQHMAVLFLHHLQARTRRRKVTMFRAVHQKHPCSVLHSIYILPLTHSPDCFALFVASLSNPRIFPINTTSCGAFS
jgi:hypothetical protein